MRNDAMRTQSLAGRNVGMDGDVDVRDQEDAQCLLSALRELLDRLSGRYPDGLGSDSEVIETWEGEDYLYVETVLSRSGGAEIDVSIQEGRAFIRMAR
jgi:hypothetical protein